MKPIAKPADMSIRNFRGIQELDLSFLPNVAHYLIGPNNSGKSTLVSGLALALKAPAFWKFSPELFDFYRSAEGEHSQTFSVVISLDGDNHVLPAVQGVGNPEDVYAIEVSGEIQAHGRMIHRHFLLNEEGNRITISPRTPLKGDTKKAYAEHDLGYRRYYARLDDIRATIPEVWLLTPENLERSLYGWKTGPLRRLASLLAKQFFETDWVLDLNGQKREMPGTLRRVHEFLGDAVRHFPFWVDDLKPRLEETLSRYIGRQAGMTLSPTVQALEEWLTDQLVVAFSADSGGPLVPLERTGQGWQGLVRMAALDVLRQYPGEGRDSVVLLYEEPETYLHPHLRRKLREVLDQLGEMGWFVLASTHGPEFISFSSLQAVMRLRREGESVTKGVLEPDQIPEAAKFQEHLDERGNHEFLFSNRVVLCEGKDDVYALRTYLEKKDTDLDGRSVSIVDLGGVQNLPAYAGMAHRLGIPWCGLTDEDLGENGKVDPMIERVRNALQSLQSECDFVPIWKGSLEAGLNLSPPQKARPEWQKANLDNKDAEELKDLFPDYVATCDEIRRWIMAGGATGEEKSGL